jgi:hypothetical protein
MINSLYYVGSVPPASILLIACARSSKMLKPRILKTSFKISLGSEAFSLDRWFKTL